MIALSQQLFLEDVLIYFSLHIVKHLSRPTHLPAENGSASIVVYHGREMCAFWSSLYIVPDPYISLE